MEDLRYPIGRFSPDPDLTEQKFDTWIAQIAAVPAQLEAALAGLHDSQLDTPYRPEGWTIRQVVHHMADSHANAYVRCRLGLTEEHPRIKPYDEKKWAELEDARTAPVEMSLTLLRPLHERWVRLLKATPRESFQRTVDHPEMGSLSLAHILQIYAWHGRHHVAHITELRRRQGW